MKHLNYTNIDTIFDILNNYYDKNANILLIPSLFNKKLKFIPKETKILIFFDYYNYSIFNQYINNLPKCLTHLTLGHSFNKPIFKMPNSLTYLKYGHTFNCPVNNLPKFLSHLVFGYCFNQHIDKLPKFLTHLTLGYCFNKSINNLPSSLTHLSFSNFLYNHFNHNIFNLPVNIKKIIISKNKKHLLCKIPFNCKIIEIL
jgi:hypothetical protein